MTVTTLSPRTHADLRDDAPAPVGPLLPVVGADLHAPVVHGGSVPYAGLDVAATAPALTAVADRISTVLSHYGSAHRGSGYASRVTTDALEHARATIGRCLGARPDDDVVLTRNTTDAITLLSSALPAGARVVVLDIEHHANLLPWRRHEVRTVPARATLAATIDAVEEALASSPTTLLAVTGASNVTGEVLPIAELAGIAHRHGARISIDAAQLAPHRRIDIAELGIDYLAVSGHKLYAPFGAGALIGRHDWLEAAPAYLPGGGAVREVTTDSVSWASSPQRHEGGTPNVLGAVALATALQVLHELPAGAREDHESALLHRLDAGLRSIPGVTPLLVWPDAPDRVGVASFVVEGYDAAYVSCVLSAEHGIGVRDGRFCAHPLLARLSPDASAVRASIGVGTTSEHVDRLIDAVRGLTTSGSRWTYESTAGGWTPVPETRDLDPLGLGTTAGSPSPCETPV